MPRVEIVQKHNTAARRLYIRGHNGKIYPYLVMNDACLTESRREERVLQLLRLLNPCLEKRKETTKRHLFFTGTTGRLRARMGAGGTFCLGQENGDGSLFEFLSFTTDVMMLLFPRLLCPSLSLSHTHTVTLLSKAVSCHSIGLFEGRCGRRLHLPAHFLPTGMAAVACDCFDRVSWATHATLFHLL